MNEGTRVINRRKYIRTIRDSAINQTNRDICSNQIICLRKRDTTLNEERAKHTHMHTKRDTAINEVRTRHYYQHVYMYRRRKRLLLTDMKRIVHGKERERKGEDWKGNNPEGVEKKKEIYTHFTRLNHNGKQASKCTSAVFNTTKR